LRSGWAVRARAPSLARTLAEQGAQPQTPSHGDRSGYTLRQAFFDDTVYGDGTGEEPYRVNMQQGTGHTPNTATWTLHRLP